MSGEVTIPLLPCRGIDETLAFYRAMGFEVTYQQAKPNNYAVVRRGDIELHFFTLRGYEPASSYSSCYVYTPDVDTLYRELTGALRQAYGRVPSAGIPRIIPLKAKAGRREFIAVDPGGNWIRIGQLIAAPAGDAEDEPDGAALSRLGKALRSAALLSDAGQDEKAARMLDAALAHHDPAPAAQRFQALVYRAGMAITMGEQQLGGSLLGEARRMQLGAGEHELPAADLERADELEALLAASSR